MRLQVVDVDQVRRGRTMLAIALLAAVIMIPALVKGWAAAFMVCLVAGWLSGLSGIRDVARGTGANAPLMYASLVACIMPGLNIVPLAYYALRAHRALAGPRERPAPSPRPAARSGAAEAAAARATTGAPRPVAPHVKSSSPLVDAVTRGKVRPIHGAIASVKQASLDRANGEVRQVPDGARLRVKLPATAGKPFDEGDEPVMRATQGLFAVCYLVDRGKHYTWATMREMSEAGMSLEELHGVGLANLVALANGANPGLRVLPQEGGYYGLVMGGEFEASLVLVDELWDHSLREYLPHHPVVCIPSRDMCAFADAGSASGIAALRRIVERVTHQSATPRSHLVSDRLLERREGRWRPYAPGDPADLPPLEFKL